MTRKIDHMQTGARLAREAGGWIECRVPQRNSQLRLSKWLAEPCRPRTGNLRFAIDGQHSYLIAELHDVDGLISFEEAQALFFETEQPSTVEVSHLDVAAALAEAGGTWEEVESGRWQAALDDSRNARCQLMAVIADGGVDICCRLADWETDLQEPSQAAIRRFFAAAHARVRCVRYTLQDRQANACSFASADRLDVEVSDSVAAVLTAHQLVSREVWALTVVDLAQQYLELIGQ